MRLRAALGAGLSASGWSESFAAEGPNDRCAHYLSFDGPRIERPLLTQDRVVEVVAVGADSDDRFRQRRTVTADPNLTLPAFPDTPRCQSFAVDALIPSCTESMRCFPRIETYIATFESAFDRPLSCEGTSYPSLDLHKSGNLSRMMRVADWYWLSSSCLAVAIAAVSQALATQLATFVDLQEAR